MAQRSQLLTKLTIIVFFVFPLFLLICSMFPCKNCSEGFSALSARGLKQHQKKCQAYLNQEASANERRKANVTSKNIRRTKLKERKVRLGPLAAAALGVSFFCF